MTKTELYVTCTPLNSNVQSLTLPLPDIAMCNIIYLALKEINIIMEQWLNRKNWCHLLRIASKNQATHKKWAWFSYETLYRHQVPSKKPNAKPYALGKP